MKGEVEGNFNRFMTGAITLDIVGSKRSLMTFAKLGRFLIFGMVQKGPGKWDGTKVHVSRGHLKPEKVTIPGGVLDLFKAKARDTALAVQSMSPTQVAKIEDHIIKNLDQFLASDQAEAIRADIEMFGADAVRGKDKK